MKKYVPDTSVIIEKAVSKLIKEKKIKGKILIPHAVVSELEAQCNRGLEIGFLGLEELQELQKLKSKDVEVEFIGERPDEHQIRFAKSGEIDAYIRGMAFEQKAILITADKVQSESGKAFGLDVMYLQLRVVKDKLEIEKFFDNTTMSVHLKEKCFPFGKKGLPGAWHLQQIGNVQLKGEEIESMAKEIVEKSRIDPEAFIEIQRKGSTIVQYHDYRIVIVRPPVSDGMEMTIVRPLHKLNLDDYEIQEELKERLKTKARGIIIAGEVGSGKSTFAQALGENYSSNMKIVKTIESPRDLQLNDNITQYSKNLSSSEEIHDILFLSRPDYIIFDEMRDTPDFKLYADLRLAGSNFIGVLHAAAPIDTIQRFIGRIETGMIPGILDTILYIESGKIKKVLTLALVVKVPTGMVEADLARPVIEVRDFSTSKLEYEIYSYGEQTVVIPVDSEAKSGGVNKLAEKEIQRFFSKYGEADVEIVSSNRAIVYVDEDEVGRIIGTKGKNIEEIEKKLGISLDIRELKAEKRPTKFNLKEDKQHIIIYANPGVNVEVLVNDKFLFSAFASKKGEIKIHKKSNVGLELLKAMASGKKIEVKA
ncbi:MAG TPA: PINc/VapC family ATPase [Candidatus Nanoarchaeia archaeon]|nr:PINc/VapC family ATPase [Candidatus Nanoarchaeia archaeon]